MHNTFAHTIEDMRGLINEWSAPVLLAVSGGVDSMCMADLFASMDRPLPFALAHCNFRLRGEDSDGDEKMVRTWAGSRGVRIHVRSFDTEAYARERGISIEMAARDLRYSWFASLCRENGYKAVAVAHNANDNAETMILNILRGAGLRGLQGMSEVSSLPCPDAEGIFLIRPLLKCTRKQIEGYAMAHGITWREDRTNASSDYKRNRIRNEVFPIFEGINPSFVRTMNREMKYFSEAAEIVEDHCNAQLDGVVMETEAGIRVSVQALMGKRHWKYLLYHALNPFGFNSAVLNSVEDLLVSGRTLSGKRFESEDYVLLTERRELLVLKKAETGEAGDLLVECEGEYTFGGRRFSVSVVAWEKGMSLKQQPGIMIFDAARLTFPFRMRRWEKGDWMIPFGMKGRKKLSDLFADLKYGHNEKDDAVVIDVMSDSDAGSSRVAGVLGVRMDDMFKVGPDTRSVIRICNLDKS